jgi:hypothetical protein
MMPTKKIAMATGRWETLVQRRRPVTHHVHQSDGEEVRAEQREERADVAEAWRADPQLPNELAERRRRGGEQRCPMRQAKRWKLSTESSTLPVKP